MTPPPAQTRLLGGRYRLEESIGRGGMGTVWRGHDEVLGRTVAVKEVRFPPELGEKEQQDLRKRTLREARATARLSHPNVVTTYDVVEEGGLPYIVMELLAARSLSDVLRDDGALPPHRVAQIGLELLSALELSHRQGVVHRDVKPGNVLITDEGRAVLTDFGIATMAGDPALTSTGVVLGSPAYMSPERARGQKPGPEADLWSLGATLYSAAEGRPPYDGENALSTLTAVISDAVEPPRVGGPLAEAILGLLEKDPAQRMTINQTRALLTRAASDRSTAPAAPAADTDELDRASRTQALPIGAPVSAAGSAMSPDVESSTPPPAPVTRNEPIWREELRPAQPRRSNPAGWLLAALLVLALSAGLGYVALRGDGGGANPSAKVSSSASTSSSPSPSPTTSSPSATKSRTSSPAARTASAGNAVPPGFTLRHDPTGFSVAVPDGWRAVRSGTHVDFREPGGSRYLRVDQTDRPKPDAKTDWENQEKSVSRRLPNYHRIRIDAVTYRDYNAADWEFTWGSGPTHVLNRGMNTGAKGYALYWSTPERQWDTSRAIFKVITNSFEPAN
jgi:serine/threonine protein kinase